MIVNSRVDLGPVFTTVKACETGKRPKQQESCSGNRNRCDISHITDVRQRLRPVARRSQTIQPMKRLTGRKNHRDRTLPYPMRRTLAEAAETEVREIVISVIAFIVEAETDKLLPGNLQP